MRKYIDIFKFSLKSEFNFKLYYFFSLFSFVIHIFVFNQLWDFILREKTILGYTKNELIWYIIIGEFIAYSIGKKNYQKISDTIKSGDIANLLVKPVSFIKYMIAEELTCVVNVIVNLVFAIILGIVMGGIMNVTLIQMILLICSIIMSLVLSLLIQIVIGLLAFFTEENQSFYLIISKAMLLLVFTPLEFFPSIVQNILKLLPTTYIVYPVGKILVDFQLNNALMLMLGQLVSLIAISTAVVVLSWKGVKNINVNGG